MSLEEYIGTSDLSVLINQTVYRRTNVCLRSRGFRELPVPKTEARPLFRTEVAYRSYSEKWGYGISTASASIESAIDEYLGTLPSSEKAALISELSVEANSSSCLAEALRSLPPLTQAASLTERYALDLEEILSRDDAVRQEFKNWSACMRPVGKFSNDQDPPKWFAQKVIELQLKGSSTGSEMKELQALERDTAALDVKCTFQELVRTTRVRETFDSSFIRDNKESLDELHAAILRMRD